MSQKLQTQKVEAATCLYMQDGITGTMENASLWSIFARIRDYWLIHPSSQCSAIKWELMHMPEEEEPLLHRLRVSCFSSTETLLFLSLCWIKLMFNRDLRWQIEELWFITPCAIPWGADGESSVCRHWQVILLRYLLPMLPSPSCTASVDFVAENRKLKYLSRKPTSNRSAHPFLHWTCWDHKLRDSYQLRYPARTARGEYGHGSKHSAILEHQRSVGAQLSEHGNTTAATTVKCKLISLINKYIVKKIPEARGEN